MQWMSITGWSLYFSDWFFFLFLVGPFLRTDCLTSSLTLPASSCVMSVENVTCWWFPQTHHMNVWADLWQEGKDETKRGELNRKKFLNLQEVYLKWKILPRRSFNPLLLAENSTQLTGMIQFASACGDWIAFRACIKRGATSGGEK